MKISKVDNGGQEDKGYSYIYIPKDKWEKISPGLRKKIRFYETTTEKYNNLLKEAYKEAGV